LPAEMRKERGEKTHLPHQDQAPSGKKPLKIGTSTSQRREREKKKGRDDEKERGTSPPLLTWGKRCTLGSSQVRGKEEKKEKEIAFLVSPGKPIPAHWGKGNRRQGKGMVTI